MYVPKSMELGLLVSFLPQFEVWRGWERKEGGGKEEGGGEVEGFGHPSAHAFVQWTLTLQTVALTDWLLDSFTHSFTHAFVQWTVTYVVGLIMTEWMLDSFSHSLTHAFVQ